MTRSTILLAVFSGFLLCVTHDVQAAPTGTWSQPDSGQQYQAGADIYYFISFPTFDGNNSIRPDSFSMELEDNDGNPISLLPFIAYPGVGIDDFSNQDAGPETAPTGAPGRQVQLQLVFNIVYVGEAPLSGNRSIYVNTP